ncbi:hypothetical protein FHR71_005641 [Methylobacterium sp. RAS18]|nr:hypothetical protein [Methylobacterium sp. RAS18]
MAQTVSSTPVRMTIGRPLRLPFTWSNPATKTGIDLNGATVTASVYWAGGSAQGTVTDVDRRRGRLRLDWSADDLQAAPPGSTRVLVTITDTSGAVFDLIWPLTRERLPNG